MAITFNCGKVVKTNPETLDGKSDLLLSDSKPKTTKYNLPSAYYGPKADRHNLSSAH